MNSIKVLFVAIVFVVLSAATYAQGCMGGGGDVVSVHGFIQPQFNYNLNGTDNNGVSLDQNNFTFNRARIGVLGEIPYDIEYYFFIEASSFKTAEKMPHLLDAYVSYTRFGTWAKISLGQFKSPFSLEQSTSCSGLYTVNRSEVVNQLAGPQRDLGVLVTGGNDTTFVQYSVGVMNGVGINVVDNNNNKDVLGRLVFRPLDFLSVGGSFRMGKINPTDLTQELNEIYRYGGELELKYNNFLLQGEYIAGQDVLHSASRIPVYGGCGGIVGFETKQPGTYNKGGFMIMAAYLTKWNIEPVVKFDTWNSDQSVTNQTTNYLTFGVNYYVNDYSRVQVNYVNVSESNPVVNDMIMVQLQAKF
jgi:phosphate-selective porin